MAFVLQVSFDDHSYIIRNEVKQHRPRLVVGCDGTERRLPPSV
jgi:hypothetical protein